MEFTIQPNEGELQLLDWVLCGQGSSISASPGELLEHDDLRERIWRMLIQSGLGEKNAALDLSETESRRLLALLPTTFRWTTGEDCGWGLKVKIAHSLWLKEEDAAYRSRELMRKSFEEDQNATSTFTSTNAPKITDPPLDTPVSSD